MICVFMRQQQLFYWLVIHMLLVFKLGINTSCPIQAYPSRKLLANRLCTSQINTIKNVAGWYCVVVRQTGSRVHLFTSVCTINPTTLSVINHWDTHQFNCFLHLKKKFPFFLLKYHRLHCKWMKYERAVINVGEDVAYLVGWFEMLG